MWESETLTPETILTRSQKTSDTPIKANTLEDFFAQVTAAQDWYDDEDREISQRFGDLQGLFATLENVHVFRLGTVEIDVYIVGAISPDLVALKKTVIET